MEGYDTQRLIVVIPFVCKVLEQCIHSSVFKPPNPWLVAILRLMVELYDFAELKLNLKFEIEVLCKTLSLDLKGKCCCCDRDQSSYNKRCFIRHQTHLCIEE